MEIELLSAVDRFGAQAVFGRPVGVGESRRLLMAELIVKGYALETAAANMVEWRRSNRGLVAALDEARKIAREEGLIRGE